MSSDKVCVIHTGSAPRLSGSEDVCENDGASTVLETPTLTPTLTPGPRRLTRTRQKPKTTQSWLWNVVIIDDDAHSYEYVIAMMQELFAKPLEGAFRVALDVDSHGRAICLTTHKEHAELKRDQILAYGKDPLIVSCKGSMRAIIEPAACSSDDDDLTH